MGILEKLTENSRDNRKQGGAAGSNWAHRQPPKRPLSCGNSRIPRSEN